MGWMNRTCEDCKYCNSHICRRFPPSKSEDGHMSLYPCVAEPVLDAPERYQMACGEFDIRWDRNRKP